MNQAMCKKERIVAKDNVDNQNMKDPITYKLSPLFQD
jgi:hypothetical protein